jgi:hypothetical protein
VDIGSELVSTYYRYFGENGWPSSKILETAPSSDEDREKLVDVIQVRLFMSLVLNQMH